MFLIEVSAASSSASEMVSVKYTYQRAIKFYSRAWRDRKGICQAWYDHLMNDIMICLEGRMMRLGPQAFPLNILSGGCVGVFSVSSWLAALLGT